MSSSRGRREVGEGAGAAEGLELRPQCSWRPVVEALQECLAAQIECEPFDAQRLAEAEPQDLRSLRAAGLERLLDSAPTGDEDERAQVELVRRRFVLDGDVDPEEVVAVLDRVVTDVVLRERRGDAPYVGVCVVEEPVEIGCVARVDGVNRDTWPGLTSRKVRSIRGLSRSSLRRCMKSLTCRSLS